MRAQKRATVEYERLWDSGRLARRLAYVPLYRTPLALDRHAHAYRGTEMSALRRRYQRRVPRYLYSTTPPKAAVYWRARPPEGFPCGITVIHNLGARLTRIGGLK